MISVALVFVDCLDRLISKLTRSSATAAYRHECLFHTAVALDLQMSMNIDIGGRGGIRQETYVG